MAAREGNHANLAVLFEKVGAVDLSEVMILAGQPKERNNFHMELPFQQFSQANRAIRAGPASASRILVTLLW